MEEFVLLVQPYYLQILSSALSESQNRHESRLTKKLTTFFWVMAHIVRTLTQLKKKLLLLTLIGDRIFLIVLRNM